MTFFDAFGQVFYTLALRFEEASKISPFFYLMIVIGFLADVLLFNYQFTFIQILGSLLIFSSLMVGAYL